jgi:hypothetical protein
MDNRENAYNQALELLQKGRFKEEVLLELAEFKNELAPLLEISTSLLALPKNVAPRPAMQRKYMLAPSKGFWLTWIHISKFAGISMSAMLLVSALTVTGYATFKSSPGQTLFAVKKSAEKLQLILAYNQDKKASIQVQITQNRLNEAKEIFSNPTSNIAQEQAALTELSDQTSNAVAAINTVAINDPKSNKNHPLLASLESIAKEQQNLLTDIKPGGQIQAAANSALKTLNQNSEKISKIKQYVAIASNDQALAILNADPNSVAVLGEINAISNTQITVEKTTFELTSKTIVNDSEGNTLNINSLKLNGKVNIVGIKDKNKLLAEQILITANQDSQPLVKGASSISGTETSTVESLIKEANAKSAEQHGSSTNTTVQKDPNSALGSFILEDPSPQYSPN